jgi:hypothetical protein
MNMDTSSNRRTFIKAVAATGAGLALASARRRPRKPKPARKTRLGFDNFSVRAMKWNAGQLIDYAASLKLDSLFLTDLDVYESFEEGYLRDLKKKADDNGLVLYAGSWSICPTSKVFQKQVGHGGGTSGAGHPRGQGAAIARLPLHPGHGR